MKSRTTPDARRVILPWISHSLRMSHGGVREFNGSLSLVRIVKSLEL